MADGYDGLADRIIIALRSANPGEVHDMIREMRDRPTPDPALNTRIRVACLRRLTQLGEPNHGQEKEEQ